MKLERLISISVAGWMIRFKDWEYWGYLKLPNERDRFNHE